MVIEHNLGTVQSLLSDGLPLYIFSVSTEGPLDQFHFIIPILHSLFPFTFLFSLLFQLPGLLFSPLSLLLIPPCFVLLILSRFIFLFSTLLLPILSHHFLSSYLSIFPLSHLLRLCPNAISPLSFSSLAYAAHPLLLAFPFISLNHPPIVAFFFHFVAPPPPS